MQFNKKDKQALQEKYKAQRQAMWSGKQAASQDSEQDAANEPDNQTVLVESSRPMETAGEETSQDNLSLQTESEVETPPTAESTEEKAELERESDRVFWEEDREGGPNLLTWKLVLAVIGVAIVLIGVGVYLGFLFAS